jgi:hypothetical protein
VATAIGGNTRIISGKDMEHLSMLMETDTWGNTCRVANTGMEYTEIQMEMYTMDNRNKKKKNGHGYFRWADGDEYYGQYKNDLRDGEGIK